VLIVLEDLRYLGHLAHIKTVHKFVQVVEPGSRMSPLCLANMPSRGEAAEVQFNEGDMPAGDNVGELRGEEFDRVEGIFGGDGQWWFLQST
jgi:hypothetical protein